MASPASSGPSTPLHRVFRGLKFKQVITIPSMGAAWLKTINELKNSYLRGHWRECESKCLRLIDNSTHSPVVRAYLLFLIGSCVEMHARNMHQYSAAKTKMMEDAIRWFEECERTLSVNANLRARNRDSHDFSNTPRMSSVRGQRAYGSNFEVSPLMLKRERIANLTNRISRLIDRDECAPFGYENDSPLSGTLAAGQRSQSRPHFGSSPEHRLRPLPLRVYKQNQQQVDDTFNSPTKSFASHSVYQDMIYSVNSPDKRDGSDTRLLANILGDMSDYSWGSDTWDSSELSYSDEARYDANDQLNVALSRRDSSEYSENEITLDPARESRIRMRTEAFRQQIEDRVAQKMRRAYDNIIASTSGIVSSDELRHVMGPSKPVETANIADGTGGLPHSFSDMIRDCLGQESSHKLTTSMLKPMPHSSSAKPLPLCLKPKVVDATASTTSDTASLARLLHVWDNSSFGGIYMVDSDCHSLKMVESTWRMLCEKYRGNESSLDRQVARYHDRLLSATNSLQTTITALRQLARDTEHHRQLHLYQQKGTTSKSYWSFSALSNESTTVNDSSDVDTPGSDQQRPSRTMDLPRNVGWAAPGTVLNETKEARIERLRRDKFQSVGLRNKRRGHKGDKWYSEFCDKALREMCEMSEDQNSEPTV